jgi:hypothetical protein
MKKLFILSFFLLIAGSLFAQRTVSAASGSTTSLASTESSVVVTTTASDTIGGTATKYWLFNINKPKLQFYSFVINIDTILTTSRVVANRTRVQFFGSLNGTTFVQIGSNIFHNVNAGTGTDSTFAVSDVATGVLWKYIKVNFTGIVANKASKPTTIQLKVADK